MPHLRIRGLNERAMKDLSRTLPKELAQVLSTSEDNFTVEKIATTFYRDGEIVPDDQIDPMIEFLWFDRGSDVQEVTAKKVTEIIQKHTTSQFIAVIFINLPKENYFENGKHF